MIWLIGFSGVDGPEGHASVSEHLWGAMFPQQSGHDTLGLYSEPLERASTWVTLSAASLSCRLEKDVKTKKMEAGSQFLGLKHKIGDTFIPFTSSVFLLLLLFCMFSPRFEVSFLLNFFSLN